MRALAREAGVWGRWPSATSLQACQRDLKPSSGLQFMEMTVKVVAEICSCVNSSATVKGGMRWVAQLVWHLTSSLDTITLSWAN